MFLDKVRLPALKRAIEHSAVFPHLMALRGLLMHREPILIYQMGKVGSKTMYNALRKAGFYPLHVHYVAPEQWAERRALYGNNDHYTISAWIRWTQVVWPRRLHIITIVRDPVARFLSEVYQRPEQMGIDLDEAPQTIATNILALMRKHQFQYAFTWMDRNILPICNVDVLAEPFDREAGYRIYHTDRADVLLLQLERMDKLFSGVVSTFMGRSVSTVSRRNVTTTQHPSYAAVKRLLRITRPEAEHLYAHEWVCHFYTPAQRTAFIERWSGARQ